MTTYPKATIYFMFSFLVYLVSTLFSTSYFKGDFGIAKSMDSTLDMAQTCVGTPCYLSPEVCQDLPYSSKADMWVSKEYLKYIYFYTNNATCLC